MSPVYSPRYQAGHFPTNGRNSPTWGNFTLCRRKFILPRREKMSMFASVFTVTEKSHFDNSSTFKTNQYSIYVSVKSRISKGHTFLGPKRALFVAKLDSEGTLFCGAAALCRTLTYAVFQALIHKSPSFY